MLNNVEQFVQGCDRQAADCEDKHTKLDGLNYQWVTYVSNRRRLLSGKWRSFVLVVRHLDWDNSERNLADVETSLKVDSI